MKNVEELHANDVSLYPQIDESLTNLHAVALHLFPVFQVHGPHVTVKQTGRVRNCVGSCAMFGNDQQ